MRMTTGFTGMVLLTMLLAMNASAQDDPDPYFIDSDGDGIDGVLADAIFVAPPPIGINSAGRGTTPSDPVATIGFGISRAVVSARHQVLIQVGSYSESITLQAGVHLYGGYDTTWVHVPSTETVATIVQGGGTAILANAINSATTVAFLTVRAANAITAGDSSYAMRITSSAGPIRIRYNRIEPGTGAAGAAGTNGNPAAQILTEPGNGANAEQTTSTTAKLGGLGGTSACGRDGGKGGNGGVGDQNGVNGSQGIGGTSGGPSGQGSSTIADGGNGGIGHMGTSGLNGGAGAVTVDLVGPISMGTYVSLAGLDGASGVHGNAGGGGGGGGGQDCNFCNADLGAGGGGGGAGGCGGGGAHGGGNGGASIGMLISASSNISIQDTQFLMHSGGPGGDGGDGAPGGSGQDGADGGTKVGTNGGAGGKGGGGGNGGVGGSGAGGHGGPAIGIFDPSNVAAISHLRYVPATIANPGSNGFDNGNPAPSPGRRDLRYPTAATAQGNPTSTIVPFTIYEPVTGTSTAYIPVTLSGTTEAITTMTFTVANGTASGAGIDFTLANGSVVFNPWTNQASIAVQVHADVIADGGETFTISATGPGAGAPATITIIEDALFANGFD